MNKKAEKIGPRETLINYLEAWKATNWAQMAQYLQLSWAEQMALNQVPVIEALQVIYQNRLIEYEFIAGSDLNNVVYAAHIRIKIGIARNVTQTMDVLGRVICEEAPLLPSPEGQWGVNPNSLTYEAKDLKP